MTTIQGGRGRVQDSDPRTRGVSRKTDSQSVLVKVVLDLLAITEGLLQPGPLPVRVDLRMARFRLYEAFPKLRLNDIDLAHELAEQDGEELADDGP